MMKNLMIMLGCVALNLMLFAGWTMFIASEQQPNWFSKLNDAGLQGRELVADFAETLERTAEKVTPNMALDAFGSVDPESETLVVTGTGVMPGDGNHSIAQAQLMAAKAAQIDALQKLALTLAGARMESSAVMDLNTLREYMVSEAVTAKIRGAEVLATRYMDDGSVEVDLELKM